MHRSDTREPPARTEAQFLADYDPSLFDQVSVAVDVAILTVTDGALGVILVQRGEHPDLGRWAIPGGFVALDESLDEAARRVLSGKAGLDGVFLEQLYTFGSPDRDPRCRVISVAHYALVDVARLRAPAEQVMLGTIRVPWEGETGGPVEVVDASGGPLALAFDHADILGTAVKRIRGKLDYTPIGFQLLPERFTLRQLQVVHETVLARPVNKDSFRRRMLASGQLEATGERERRVGHRPAALYRFRSRSAV